MSTTKIRGSTGTNPPSSLAVRQLAYVEGSGLLYIGRPSDGEVIELFTAYPHSLALTVGYGVFAAASTTSSVTLFTLPAGWEYSGSLLVVPTAAWTGSGITSCKLDVGIASDEDLLTTDTDGNNVAYELIGETPSGTTFYNISLRQNILNVSSGTEIKAKLTTVGGNVNQLSTGSFDISLVIGRRL